MSLDSRDFKYLHEFLNKFKLKCHLDPTYGLLKCKEKDLKKYPDIESMIIIHYSSLNVQE